MKKPNKLGGTQKLPTFLQTTALQRKLTCRSALLHDGVAPSLRIAYDCGGALPAYMPVSGLALFLSSCVSRFKFEVRFNLTIHRLDLFSGRKFPADRMTNRRTPTTPDRRDRGSRPCASHHLLSSALACCYPFDGKHYTKKRERGTSAAPCFERNDGEAHHALSRLRRSFTILSFKVNIR